MKLQIKVLLVEDTPAEANLIQLHLAGGLIHQYTLVTVEDISSAVDVLDQSQFDAILLDYNLPDSEGLMGLQNILDVAENTPVVMLTNYEDEATALEAVRAGAQDYLFKRDLDTALLERSIRYGIERQSAQDALRRSEERYYLALDAVRDGIWDWNISSRTSYFSDRLYEMLEFGEEEFESEVDSWMDYIHPDDREKFEKVLDAHLMGATPSLEFEHRVKNSKGEYFWVLSRGKAIRDKDGAPIRMVGALSDISKRKAAEEQLRHLALNDLLTELPNRTLFLDRVKQAIAVAQRRKNHRFAVIFIDLDRFKSINDSLGHTVGNLLLKAVANRLNTDVRPTDTLARLGGDEFALLILDYADFNAVLQIAKRINREMAQKFVIDDAELHIGASIGIATYSEKYLQPEEILRDADIAMYRAKRHGSDYEVFDAEMRDLATRRLRLETELRHAIAHKEFTVYYQPIVSTSTGRIVGFEALVRWHHPRAGLVYPKLFIQVAEDTGLVVPIGELVFNQAMEDFKRFYQQCPDARDVSLSINISGKIFNTRNVVKRIKEALEYYNFDPRLLNLEITEHAVMDHQSRALRDLAKIRDLGIGLHIDDFGTGYSSLSHLQKFSYDTLKIDSSFVRNMTKGSENEAIVRSIIAMGKLMGIDIIAEGVETEEQLAWLTEMGCPKVQGFLFSEAMPNLELEKLFKTCTIEAVSS